MPGHLSFTVKFSTLPIPLQVRGGIKIGIQAEEKIVSMILPRKAWLRLEELTRSYPRWTAVLSGPPDYYEGQEIVLRNPSVRVFEKTAPSAPETNPEIPATSVPATLADLPPKPACGK